MKDYIVYDAQGNILRTGKCIDSMLSAQAGDDEFVIEGVAYDSTDTIVDGSVVTGSVPIDISLVAQELRQERNIRLQLTDWTQMPDAPLTDAKKLEWRTYRQALRDLPSQYLDETDIDNVVFPNPPE